ncbi:MAG: PQQ-binding-like beta-propeller repeat protein [Bacteroidota bacterium]
MKQLIFIFLMCLTMINILKAQIQKTDSIYNIWNQVGDIAFQDNYLYAKTENGLRVIDYNDPDNPFIVTSRPLKNNLSSTLLKIKGNYLYSSFIDGIEIFDITDSQSPVKVSEISKQNGEIKGFLIANNHVYCIEHEDTPIDDIAYLVTHDVTDKTAPVYKNSEELGNSGSISDFIVGDYIFVQKKTGTYPQIYTYNYVYSIASPAFPTNMGEISYFPASTDFQRSDTLYTKDETNIYELNITNPLEPDTLAAYTYDGLADWLLNVHGDSIITNYNGTGKIYTKSGTDSATFAGMFDLPEGNMNFKTLKDDRLYYPQTDSASIVNLSLVPESGVNKLFDQLFYNRPFDLNNFTIHNLEGDDSWQLQIVGWEEEVTEAALNLSSTNGTGTMVNKDWLISPQVDLPANYTNLNLSFTHFTSYMGASLNPGDYFTVLVSENYNGVDPEAASWSEIAINFYDEGQIVDLSNFAGKSIHIAFRCVNPDTESFSELIWRVRKVKIQGVNEVNVAGSGYWQIANDAATVLDNNGNFSFDLDEDWLTTTEISLNGYNHYYFNFLHKVTYHPDETIFGVYVSENYDGSNPGNATWTKVENFNWPEADFYDFRYSGNIDLTAYAGKTIHIGFKYITTDTEYQRWYIKDMNLLATNGELPYRASIFNMNPEFYNYPKITGVQVSGNQAYASHRKVVYQEDGSSQTMNRFSALDITDKENIIETAHKNIISNYDFDFQYYVNDSLLTVRWNEDSTELYRYNTNDEFEEKGSIINSKAAFHYIADNHAVVSLEGSSSVFRIYDITDENNPLPVFQFTNDFYYPDIPAVDKENNDLYLATTYNVDGSYIRVVEKWDISDITAPEKTAVYSIPTDFSSSSGLFVKDSTLYNYERWAIVGSDPVSYGKIVAFELSDTSFVETGGSYLVTSPKGLVFNDNYAFFGVGYNTEGHETGVHVISLQNPANLERTFLLPDGGTLIDLDVNNEVVTAAYSKKIDLYDLSTIPLPPEPFNLLSPQGEVNTTDTLLTWEPSVDPNGNNPEYEVWIADNEAFTNATVDTTSETSYPVGNLLPGQSFYWKVTALDPYTDNVPANQTFQFTLPGIELIAPEGEIASTNTALTWRQVVKPNGSPLSYEVLFANDADFTNPDTLSSADTVLAVNDLLPGQYYFWKVRAKNDLTVSTWSPQYKNFSVAVAQATQVYAKDLGSSAETGVTMLDEDIIYAASTSSVHRFDGSGNLQYTLQVNGQIKSSTTITSDHRVYIASTDNNLYTFNQNGVGIDGWPVALGAQLEASVAIDDDHFMYLGTSNGIFQCIAATGSVEWSYNVGAAVKSAAVINQQDTLYIINTNGRVLAFDLANIDPSNPQPAWIFETGHPISNAPAIVDDYIYLTSDDGYLLKIKNNENAAELVFEAPTNGSCYSSPVVDASNDVYFGADSGMVYAINGETGDLKWKSPTYYTRFAPEAITASGALASDGLFYIGDTHGVIYGLSTANGAILWSHRGADAPVSGALLYNASQLYYTAGNQMICLAEPTLKTPETLKKETPYWATFQGNNQRTGNPDEIVPIQMFEVTLSANPAEGGTVAGGGTFADGSAITVTATPGTDYEFVNWTEGGSQISEQATYSFAVDSERALTANFQTNTNVNSPTAEDLKIYPNPAKKLIKIESDHAIRSIRLMDISGQTIRIMQYPENSSLTIDVSQFTKGLYILEIATPNKVKQTRLIIH